MDIVIINGEEYIKIERPYIEDCVADDGRYTDAYIKLKEHKPQW